MDYQVIDGCQCDCVVAWGPLMEDAAAPSPSEEPVLPALPPMGPHKKAKLIQKLEVPVSSLCLLVRILHLDLLDSRQRHATTCYLF